MLIIVEGTCQQNFCDSTSEEKTHFLPHYRLFMTLYLWGFSEVTDMTYLGAE